ncbi:MAG: TRAP transporter small permease [Chloroflexi bacterium]|nr:TRAP transporter small permease [Chloroflexota bacterium]
MLIPHLVYEVVARYFFNKPTIWAVDFTEYGMVYVTFLGSAWLLRQRSHIQVDMLVQRLTPRQQLRLDTVMSVVAAVVMAVFVWKGAEVVSEAWANNQVALKAWLVPRWIIMLPIPVGGLLMFIEFVRQIREGVLAWRGGAQAVAHRSIELGAGELEEQRGL